MNFGFNAWGYKLSPFEEDDAAAKLIAEKIGVPVFDFGDFVLEGGSIDVNGQGAALTTESCLLNPNRNPDLSREQIEATLREALGFDPDSLAWRRDRGRRYRRTRRRHYTIRELRTPS